jgi:hypothetical protein
MNRVHTVLEQVHAVLELADRVTSLRQDLPEQLRCIEAEEMVQIFRGFVDECAARNCSAAAFQVLLLAISRAADCVLVETQCGVVQ